MIHKITFLCTNPLECFLPPIAQSHCREYFYLLCTHAQAKKTQPCIQELIDIYGECSMVWEEPLFEEEYVGLQMNYVQTRNEQLLEKVFLSSDLICMGLPGCIKAFERIVLPVWNRREQILFLWDEKNRRGEEYLQTICREYKLQKTQMLDITEKAPV